ncbi:Uma2 family endonuclease [Desulfonema magnum]|uniref:DUF820 n=1 Tax=Desulfonema magnum TaxID=45655 RepID=A0A975BVD3_9BACT|nr:Uma2 family endonuclease [Desulfonema magnum]QTA91914.1 DUF820 [Desulfonema magnum]
MGRSAVKETHYTREEYLAAEDQANGKSEFYDGEIIVMAGGSRNHSVICFNLIRRIGEGIDDKDCVGFDSNMKLDITEHNVFVYPDVMVVCGEIEFSEDRTDIIKNPVLIIEVLSPGTEGFDRGNKFAYYRSLPSFQEYVLVAQHKPMVEIYHKQEENKWLYSVSKTPEESVFLQTIQHELFLKDIYHKVDWGRESAD